MKCNSNLLIKAEGIIHIKEVVIQKSFMVILVTMSHIDTVILMGTIILVIIEIIATIVILVNIVIGMVTAILKVIKTLMTPIVTRIHMNIAHTMIHGLGRTVIGGMKRGLQHRWTKLSFSFIHIDCLFSRDKWKLVNLEY